MTAVSKTLTRRADIPFPAHNFRANDDSGDDKNVYDNNDNILFEWTYSTKKLTGETAGERTSGDSFEENSYDSDGEFVIEIYDSAGTLVQTITGIPVASEAHTVTNGDLKSWLGAPLPLSFSARLFVVDGDLRSRYREITLERETV